jgi:hypothetical protein
VRVESAMQAFCAALGGAACVLPGLDVGLSWPWLTAIAAGGAAATFGLGWALDRRWGRDTP